MKRKKKKQTFEIFGARVDVINDNTILLENAAGKFSYQEENIRYADHESEEKLIETLIHEVGHATIYFTGIWQAGLSRELEEIIVENISKAIVKNFNVKMKK